MGKLERAYQPSVDSDCAIVQQMLYGRTVSDEEGYMSDDLYYDPWDVGIDRDPYPTYRRLRDEAPVYYNERHNFWGISRYADVDAALKDTTKLSSAKGDILEVVMTDPVMPPGIFINEDPPLHTIHRAIVSRAFTPKKMRAIEDKIRAFCVACLDPLVGGDHFDFVEDLGAELPMRTIGMLAGIPDAEQPAVRAHANQVLRNEPGKPMVIKKDHYFTGEMFGDYVEWREKNPSDDLITELLTVEFDDETGTHPQAHQTRTHRLSRRRCRCRRRNDRPTVRLDGQSPSRTPRPAQRTRRRPHTHTLRHRRTPALRTTRTTRRPLRHHRRRPLPRTAHPRGKRAAHDAGLRQPRRTPLRQPRPLRHTPQTRRPPHLRPRRPLLRRRTPSPTRRSHRP